MKKGTITKCIADIRRIAKESGYAVGEHGSKTRDLDLMAIPWTEQADYPWNLVDRICIELGWQSDVFTKKPHNRYGIIFLPRTNPIPLQYVDLSIIWPYPLELVRYTDTGEHPGLLKIDKKVWS